MNNKSEFTLAKEDCASCAIPNPNSCFLTLAKTINSSITVLEDGTKAISNNINGVIFEYIYNSDKKSGELLCLTENCGDVVKGTNLGTYSVSQVRGVYRALSKTGVVL